MGISSTPPNAAARTRVSPDLAGALAAKFRTALLCFSSAATRTKFVATSLFASTHRARRIQGTLQIRDVFRQTRFDTDDGDNSVIVAQFK